MKKKQRYERGISKRKQDKKPKQEKLLMKENFVIYYFDAVLFMKPKHRRKKMK